MLLTHSNHAKFHSNGTAPNGEELKSGNEVKHRESPLLASVSSRYALRDTGIQCIYILWVDKQIISTHPRKLQHGRNELQKRDSRLQNEK